MQGAFKPRRQAGSQLVTMENASLATTLMRKYFTDVDMIQVGVSSGEFIGGLTMLKPPTRFLLLPEVWNRCCFFAKKYKF